VDKLSVVMYIHCVGPAAGPAPERSRGMTYTCKLVRAEDGDRRGGDRRTQLVLAWNEYQADSMGEAIVRFHHDLPPGLFGRVVVSRGHTNNPAKRTRIGG